MLHDTLDPVLVTSVSGPDHLDVLWEFSSRKLIKLVLSHHIHDQKRYSFRSEIN